MTPTQEWLLLLLRYSPVRQNDMPSLLARTTAEWQDLTAEADRHGLVPLLYHRLSRPSPAGSTPVSVNERLKRGYQVCAVRNLGRFQALAPVLAGLCQAGIPVIALKGAYLAAAVYENFALRQMSDVDLLVHQEDLPRADLILIEAGFRRREFAATPSRDLNEFHYLDRPGLFRIEIHWDLFKPDYPFRFNLEEMWQAAVPVVVAGVAVRAFAPEDQLIHLASHAAIHRFEFGLRPLCDLAEVVIRKRIDWRRLAEKAERQKAGRAVGVPLALTRDLLQVQVPAETLAGLGMAGLPEALFTEARETALLNVRKKRDQGEPNPNLLLFFGRRCWRQRLALAGKRLFPSRQTVTAMYPVAVNSPWIWLYYPRVSFRIIRRNLLGIRKLLLRKIRRPTERNLAADLMDWLLP